MAIPQKPLIVTNYDVDKLTLKQNRSLFGGAYYVDDFYQFLLDHVDHVESWTVDEIGEITRAELNDVREQLFAKLRELTTPLAK